jgi:hypothetical protein
MLFGSIATATPNTWRSFYDALDAVGVTPASLVEVIQTAATSFGDDMVGVALPLLAGTGAIRLAMVIIKELLDGDIVEMVGEVFFTLLMIMFVALLLTSWKAGLLSVPETSREIMASVMSAASGTSVTPGTLGQALGDIFNPVFESLMKVLAGIWTIFNRSLEAYLTAAREGASISDLADAFGAMVRGNTAGAAAAIFSTQSLGLLMVVNFFLAIIASLAVIILFCFLLYHMMSGFISMSVVFAFGPLTLAAYPLIDSWAKKALSAIAGAIVQMAAAIFLLKILVGVLEKAVVVMNLPIAP